MASIIELIKNIRNARLGKDVRESIASAIEQTYEDATEKGSSNMEVAQARGRFDTLRERLNNVDIANNNLQNQINSLASGSPLVASSVSEMTDTTKVYVNTTDGNWYYYNGTTFVSGGVYQASEFANNSIGSNVIKKLDFQKVKFNNIFSNQSSVTKWNNNVNISYANYNRIVFDTLNVTGDTGIFLASFTELDKTKDLYCFMTIISDIKFSVFLFNGNSYVKRICGYNPLTNTSSLYFKISSNDLNIDNPKICIATSQQGTITLDNINAGNYDNFEFIYYNLVEKINQNKNYYENIKENTLETNILDWKPNYFGNDISLLPNTKAIFSLENTSSPNNSRGLESPSYNDTSKKLIIEGDIENISQETFSFNIWIYYNNKFELIAGGDKIDSNNHLKVIIDLPYYAVYKELTEYKIWIMLGQPGIVKINNFNFYFSDIAETSIYSKNFTDMIKKIDSKISSSTETKSDVSYIQAPNKKYFMQANDNGNLQLIDVIPNKTLFIGNSLLIGNQHDNYAFGMCATDINNDYYHHITQYILNIKPNATFEKISGTDFEGATSQNTVNNFLSNTLLPHLDDNIQLVIVQLGDNVNTQEKVTMFNSSCLELLQFIRTYAPNSRVVFVGEWYSSAQRQTIIANACKNSGCQFVDISNLNTTENQATIGTIITFPDGYTRTVTSAGVASHPSNIGFEKIANKIIENIF